MELKLDTDNNTKNKKTAWELIKEIPDTPEQRKIDREIAAIEKKYKENKMKKFNSKKTKISKSSKIKENIPVTNRISDFKSIQNDYGWNAGKIWNALSTYGPLDQSSILKNTKLSLNDFFVGIGWLARENKISKEMKCYKIGETNLTFEIGENAGKIWKLLDVQGQASIEFISELTDIKIGQVYSAIGWLSRENKIRMICKNGQKIYELT